MGVLAGDVMVLDEVRHDGEWLVTVVMRRGPRPLDQYPDRAGTDALQQHDSSNFRHRSLNLETCDDSDRLCLRPLFSLQPMRERALSTHRGQVLHNEAI